MSPTPMYMMLVAKLRGSTSLVRVLPMYIGILNRILYRCVGRVASWFVSQLIRGTRNSVCVYFDGKKGNILPDSCAYWAFSRCRFVMHFTGLYTTVLMPLGTLLRVYILGSAQKKFDYFVVAEQNTHIGLCVLLFSISGDTEPKGARERERASEIELYVPVNRACVRRWMFVLRHADAVRLCIRIFCSGSRSRVHIRAQLVRYINDVIYNNCLGNSEKCVPRHLVWLPWNGFPSLGKTLFYELFHNFDCAVLFQFNLEKTYKINAEKSEYVLRIRETSENQ